VGFYAETAGVSLSIASRLTGLVRNLDSGRPNLVHSSCARMDWPVATSHFGDSGSKNHAAGSRKRIGVAPIRNSPRQPMASSKASANSEAMTPPAGTSVYSMELKKLRRPAGANSTIMVPPEDTMIHTTMTAMNDSDQ